MVWHLQWLAHDKINNAMHFLLVVSFFLIPSSPPPPSLVPIPPNATPILYTHYSWFRQSDHEYYTSMQFIPNFCTKYSTGYIYIVMQIHVMLLNAHSSANAQQLKLPQQHANTILLTSQATSFFFSRAILLFCRPKMLCIKSSWRKRTLTSSGVIQLYMLIEQPI